MRLTHTSVTGRSPAGKSRTHVGRRSCKRPTAPHTGHHPLAAVVSMAYSSSPSRSDTASTNHEAPGQFPSSANQPCRPGPTTLHYEEPLIRVWVSHYRV